MTEVMQTDGDLLAAHVAGRGDAITELVRRHGAMVLGVCERIAGKNGDAEDAAQAVFISLSRKAERLRSHTNLVAWLHRAARMASQTALRTRRRRMRHESEAASMATNAPETKSDVDWESIRQHLDHAIDALSEPYRQVVVACYLEGRTQSEAATSLGLDKGTIASRCHRALEKLRRRLELKNVAIGSAALGTILAEHAASAATAVPQSLLAVAGGIGTAPANADAIARVMASASWWLKVKIAVAVVVTSTAITGGASALLAERKPSAPVPLEANRWTKLAQESDGGRSSPMFFFDSAIDRFILAGGAPVGDKRHFDAESFALGTATWENLNPPGSPFSRSGPTDAPPCDDESSRPLIDVGGTVRLNLHWDAYDWSSLAHHQWAFDRETRKLFAYLAGRTICYDVRGRSWTDLGADAFGAGTLPMCWGSLCLDPINHELVAVGGSSDQPGGTPGTHVFSLAERRWRKLEVAEKPSQAWLKRTEAIRSRSQLLASACRNRYYRSESAAETQATWSQPARALDQDLSDLFDGMADLGRTPSFAVAARLAQARIAAARIELNAAIERIDSAIDRKVLEQVFAPVTALESVEQLLAGEPSGRAHAQMAYDEAHRKIVLFGGNGLDRCYADTWVYDCASRTWEQRFPDISPSPRAGHVLAYLPRAHRVVLSGGYSIDADHDRREYGFVALPNETWTYDCDRNTWSLLTSGTESAEAPRAQIAGIGCGISSPWIGAVNDDDVLVMVDAGFPDRTTWACRMDTKRSDQALARERGVSPSTEALAWGPGPWLEGPDSDVAAISDFYRALPNNQWTALPQPATSCPNKALSTGVYDSDREQLLYWGGAQSGWMATEVRHYSVRANTWSVSAAPDLPIEPAFGSFVKASRSFRDRPWRSMQASRSYGYDPTSGLMLYLNAPYDVQRREWSSSRTAGRFRGGSLFTVMESTPHGLVAWSADGLLAYDNAHQAWVAMPMSGTAPGTPTCDGSGLCYDSKRDCLWLGDGLKVLRYDCKTGICSTVAVDVPAILGEHSLWHTQVYVPGADLILLGPLFHEAAGPWRNVAFSPASGKYLAFDLPYARDGQPVHFEQRPFEYGDAIIFVPRLGVVLQHAPAQGGRFYALRFDPRSAVTKELPGRSR